MYQHTSVGFKLGYVNAKSYAIAFRVTTYPSDSFSGDSGTRATRAEPELQNDDRGDSGTRLLGLSLSYKMMEGLLLFKF